MCEYDSKLLQLAVDDTPKATIGLIIVSTIFIWAYLDYIPFEYLLIWSLMQSVFIVSRYVNARMLSKYIQEKNKKKLREQTKFFALIIFFSSLIWSVGTLLGVMFAPTPYEFVSFIMITGLITAAVISLTYLFNVFFVYFIVMLLTQVVIMIYLGSKAHLGLAFFALIYMPVILLLSKSIYKNHLTTIESHELLESHNNELRELSITDTLTKVYNRRHFFESAKKLLSLAKRENNDKNITVDLTVSIGCGTISGTITTLEELYQEADKQLYVAKELGRNQIQ